MSSKSLLNEYTQGIDEPIQSGLFDVFKKGKLQCRIIYEDGTYSDYYKKFSKTYVITIKKRDYLVIPNCILKGKRSFICWFINNPMPINFAYQQSRLTAKELIEPEKLKKLNDENKQVLANIKIDAEGMHSLFNTRLMQGLYAREGMTMKTLIILLVVIAVIIVVLLQVTGYIDINAMISGK